MPEHNERSAEATGGCSCGAVRYVLDAPPNLVAVCHCSDCRRAAGAQSVAWLILPATAYHVVAGEPATYHSSRPVVRSFCSACGTPLSYRHEDSPDRVDVTVGSLDDPERYPPTQAVWEKEKLSWAALIG